MTSTRIEIRPVLRLCGLFALIGGVVSFLGWALDVPRLTDWYGNGISIQANSAVAVSVAGAALLALSLGWRRLTAVLGAIVLLIGASALLQYVIGINVDSLNTLLMFDRTWGRGGVLFPGRMGPPGALCWTIVGSALMMVTLGRRPNTRRVVPILGLVTLAVALFAITGYLYRASTFYTTPHLTVIALQTAVFILFISTGLVAAVGESGPMNLLRDTGASGTVARRATPVIIVLAFTLGLLRLAGEQNGWFDLATGSAARTLVEIGLLLGLLSWSLTRIRHQVVTLRESRRMIADDLVAAARLQDLSTRLLYPADLNALLQDILAAAADLTGTDKGNIQLADPVTGQLRILVHQGLGPAFVEFFANAGGPACEAASARRTRVIFEDIENAIEFKDSVAFSVLRQDDIRAVQSTPLISRDGRLLGVLNNHYRVPTRPSDRQLRYIDVLARMAADLIERCQSEDALREADRRKDEFLATLGHELRGPLAPLRNTLEIMKRMGNGSPAEQQARDTMQRQLIHLTRLVDDLIDVSRITHNKIQLRVERVALASIVHQALEGVQPLAARADLRVRADVPDEPIYLDCDPIRLVQVFGNILNNACKYTQAGGQIWVNVTRDGDEAVVGITDTGIGIPQDRLAHVFDLFTQIDVPFERTQGGLGIGLTIVKRLVEMHGGSIVVHSAGLHRGTQFIVRLPVQSELPAEEPLESSSAR